MKSSSREAPADQFQAQLGTLDFTLLRKRLETLRRRSDDLSEEGKTIAACLAANLDGFARTFNSADPSLDNLKKLLREMLTADLAFIEADPSHVNVRRLGPTDAPHTLVVSMNEQQVNALVDHFGDQLIVERDRPLSLYLRE